MSLLEEYYELNEAEKVSPAWKVLQIIFCSCAAGSGLASGFTLALVRLKFSDRCYLFTEVKISHLQGLEKEHKIINWESDTWCDYYQFTMVSSFILAVIWATLYLMCGKGGKSITGLPQPWRIVWPSLIFSLVYFVIVLSTAIRIQQGTDFFCGRKHFENKKTKYLIDKCEPLKLLLKKDLHTASTLIEVVVKTSWACAASWFFLFLLSFIRIIFVVDFQLYKICVIKIDENLQNKKEEVLKITSYEEPKSMYHDENEEKVEEENLKKAPNNVKNKFVRLFENSEYRPPPKETSNLYLAVDIRMLKSEKKREKYLRALDEAFGSNSLRSDLRISSNILPNSDASEKLETRVPLYENSKDLYYNEEDENEMSSTTTFNRAYYFGGDGRVLSEDHHSNHLLDVKKQI